VSNGKGKGRKDPLESQENPLAIACWFCLQNDDGDARIRQIHVPPRATLLPPEEKTVLRPGRRGNNPFERYAGVLQTFRRGAAEINAWLRELREGKR